MQNHHSSPHVTVISTTEELQSIRSQLYIQWQNRLQLDHTNTVGLVPTMGNLHQGHLSLIEEALCHHDHVFVSIFINPKQFGPQEDYNRYPRTLESDIEQIKKLFQQQFDKAQERPHQHKKVYIFAPHSIEEIFPAGFDTKISVTELSQKFCGVSRPGHFDGVATVVYRLLALISPDVSYFGQKDYQQTLIIRKMVDDLMLPTIIVTLPTIRDESGLALSSRNQYLSQEEKVVALHLYQHLKYLAAIVENKKWQDVQQTVEETIRLTLTSDTQWEYLAVCHPLTLSVPSNQDQEFCILGAYKIGHTRLIDNILVNFSLY